ncbi:hypothetical protein JOQ06_011217 [Pogonophryne albipinna]|uniref:Histidine N-acetyltransferase C-terminal domain-containing protein n=1 Tax=Pogonophryne albipinna TaxID=1090488 RepID=A0AAD6F568_9TELE|nr:hypothetical protein JOQ06_011217 [Pogonophryne albipinna]
MLLQGLRVAPQERGKGVAAVLQRFCSDLVKSKFPDVKVTRLTRVQLLPKDFQKYRLITKQGVLLVRFRAEELKLRLSDLGLGDIQSSLSTSFKPPPVRLDYTAVRRLYLTSDRMLGVLPNATIIQDAQPFKLLPSNMAILLKKDIDWMVDDVANPTVTSLCTFPFRVPIGDDWYYLNIDIFGKELDPVRQQLLCHLQRHTATLKGHVMCQVYLHPPLWKPMVEFCRNILNVELVKEYTEQCVLESDGVLLVRFRAEELKLRLSDLGLGDIQSSLSTSFKPPPVRLDNTAVRRLYLTSDRMLGVLPNATIIQDAQPFKLLPSNMAILLKKDIDWMVDDVANPTVTSLCTFPFRVPIGDDW